VRYRKPKSYLIVDGPGTRYFAQDQTFRDLPPANWWDVTAIELPEDAWIGHRSESEVRLRYARILDPESRIEPIDDGE
jgi:hypothetical protein